MNNYSFDNHRDNTFQNVFSDITVEMQPLMRQVYMWMFAGLLATAAIAFVVSQNVQFVGMASQWWLAIVILQVGLVLGISWGFNRINATVAIGLFFLYAVLNGLMFGVLFFAYIAQGQSMAIANAFLTTAGLFGTMSVIGYTTKVDLSKFGTYLMMAVVGIFIASIVNMFLGSGMVDLIISVVGVLVFTGLTAYDTQHIKRMAAQMAYSDDRALLSKLAIMGALKLYLDFINLFMFLLRLMGGGRD